MGLPRAVGADPPRIVARSLAPRPHARPDAVEPSVDENASTHRGRDAERATRARSPGASRSRRRLLRLALAPDTRRQPGATLRHVRAARATALPARAAGRAGSAHVRAADGA